MCVAACFYSTILHNMSHCILVGCPVAANNLTDYPIVLALGGSFEVEKLVLIEIVLISSVALKILNKGEIVSDSLCRYVCMCLCVYTKS